MRQRFNAGRGDAAKLIDKVEDSGQLSRHLAQLGITQFEPGQRCNLPRLVDSDGHGTPRMRQSDGNWNALRRCGRSTRPARMHDTQTRFVLTVPPSTT